jgi:flagellar motility protein MotE (MotC chaperone)
MTWLLSALSLLTGLRSSMFIGAGMSVIAAFLYGQHKGDTNCKAAYELALAKERIAELERQRVALENTIKHQNEIEARHEQEREQDETIISDLNAIIDEMPVDGNVCLDANFMRKLNGIR